jgi:protein phosphatase
MGFDNIEHASLSDVGVRRSHNQDNHAVLLASDPAQWAVQGHLFLVADGMGAHAVGEKASELAARIIPHTYHKHSPQGASTALRKAFLEANSTIHSQGQANREFAGMGTTATALLIRADGAWVGHVGDSRAYRIRDGYIEQLSFDHSLVWEYARRQKMNPNQVQGIPSNVIVRSLGPEPLVQVDLEGPHSVRAGDIFVLCSDGLSGQVSDHELGAVASVLPPAEACRFLVDLANLRGGPDNITVLIIRVGARSDANGVLAEDARPKAPKPWYVRMWWLVALILGTLLAAGSVLLALDRDPASVPGFVLAGLVILVGMVGLVVQYIRDQRSAAEEPEAPEPKVYSRSPCRVERPLLEKLAKAELALKQRAGDQHWEPDWALYQKHHDLAESLLGRGDVPGAFREYCRAMRTLTEALQKQRNKEESFMPVWDKSPG